jgi:hypothetical protein
MSELLRQAEQIKLSRTLNLPAAQLDFLAALDALEIRSLRERITHLLFDQHHALFHRLALAGKLVPVRINALIAQKVFGPLLAARMAGLLPPERSIRIAACLPTEFLADLCLSLDPRSAPEVLKRMPVRTVADVAQVLLARKEYVTMARFVDCLSDACIQAVVSDTRDDAALVRIAFYVESAERLNHLIALLPDERLRGTVKCTTNGSLELRQAGVSLLSRVSDRQKGRMGDAAVALGEDVLRQLVSDVGRENANPVLIAVMANMGEASRKKAESVLNR